MDADDPVLVDSEPPPGDDWAADCELPELDEPLDHRTMYIRSYHGPVDAAVRAWEAQQRRLSSNGTHGAATKAVSSALAGAAPPPSYPGRTLREILANPDAGKPPEAVVDHLAYRGRTSLLIGREKMGKTTILMQNIADGSTGRAPPLGEAHEPITVLLFLLEDALDDAVALLKAFEADPDRVVVVVPEDIPAPADFARAASRGGVDWVVIDTLTALGHLFGVKDANDTVQARALMMKMQTHARSGAAAWTLSAHSARGHDDAKGSTDWGASADILVRFTAKSEDDSTRTVRWKGRGIRADRAVLAFDEVTRRYTGTSTAPTPLRVIKVKPKPKGQRIALQALIHSRKPMTYTEWRAKTVLANSTFQDAMEALSATSMTRQLPNGAWELTDEGRSQSIFPQWQA